MTAPPPPAQMQIVMKPREKMVTFEDEPKPMSSHCPHGVPTTPRKSTGASATVLGGSGADVFMWRESLRWHDSSSSGGNNKASELGSMEEAEDDDHDNTLPSKTTPGDVIRV